MNLRQYRRSGIIQAGEIAADTAVDQVRLVDAYGGVTTFMAVGLGQAGGAKAGQWLIIYPDNMVALLSADDFSATWEPVAGPTLS